MSIPWFDRLLTAPAPSAGGTGGPLRWYRPGVVVSLWGLRRLGRVAGLHRVVRQVMNLRYRHGHRYVVRAGPNRGLVWVHHRDHQWWMPLGRYEPRTADWLMTKAGEGEVAFDIGANAGYFTLALARAVGDRGRVYAFEPVPGNLVALHAQSAANHSLAGAITVVDAAVDLTSESAAFTVEANNPNSHFADIEIVHAARRPRTEVDVRTVSIDDFVSETGQAPDLMKIDVEGAEVRVLEGARNTLRRHHPALIVSTHSDELRASCHELLVESGYDPRPLEGFEHELVAD